MEKMKKIIALLFLIAIVFTLSGCGSSRTWTPATVSSNVKTYVKTTVELLEQYLNFEISEDEFDEKIQEINHRLSQYDLLDSENVENQAEYIAARLIDSLAEYGIPYKSDIRIKEKIDILRFQIGEKTSGEIYSVTPTTSDEAQGYIKSLDFADTSYEICMLSDSENSQGIYLSYDRRNGETVESINKCILGSWDKMFSTDKVSLRISYNCYDQPVIIYSIRYIDGNLEGIIMNFESKDENSVLAQFSSKEEFSSAAQIAEKYAN